MHLAAVLNLQDESHHLIIDNAHPKRCFGHYILRLVVYKQPRVYCRAALTNAYDSRTVENTVLCIPTHICLFFTVFHGYLIFSRKRENPQKSLIYKAFCGFFVELLTRFELVTSSLPRTCSTTWAIAAHCSFSARDIIPSLLWLVNLFLVKIRLFVTFLQITVWCNFSEPDTVKKGFVLPQHTEKQKLVKVWKQLDCYSITVKKQENLRQTGKRQAFYARAFFLSCDF